jgi:hypothetical protein
MLSLEELRSAKINPAVAREAYDQASTRLADILDTRKSYEQKAFTLFSGYLTISLSLFAAGVALLNQSQPLHFVVTVWTGGVVFLVGAFLLVQALLDSRYGAMGSDPEVWIAPGVIDGGDDALPLILAYLTHMYQDRIDRSANANEGKAGWIRAGVFVGMAAPVVAAPCLWLHDAWLKTFL